MDLDEGSWGNNGRFRKEERANQHKTTKLYVFIIQKVTKGTNSLLANVGHAKTLLVGNKKFEKRK
jgi:hypothetical protein